MLIDIRHVESKTFENVSTKKVNKASTLRERIIADRIVMCLLFFAVIVYAVINS
jgi:hypothetical protein